MKNLLMLTLCFICWHPYPSLFCISMTFHHCLSCRFVLLFNFLIYYTNYCEEERFKNTSLSSESSRWFFCLLMFIHILMIWIWRRLVWGFEDDCSQIGRITQRSIIDTLWEKMTACIDLSKINPLQFLSKRNCSSLSFLNIRMGFT